MPKSNFNNLTKLYLQLIKYLQTQVLKVVNINAILHRKNN